MTSAPPTCPWISAASTRARPSSAIRAKAARPRLRGRRDAAPPRGNGQIALSARRSDAGVGLLGFHVKDAHPKSPENAGPCSAEASAIGIHEGGGAVKGRTVRFSPGCGLVLDSVGRRAGSTRSPRSAKREEERC